jgi:hypothetical protein
MEDHRGDGHIKGIPHTLKQQYVKGGAVVPRNHDPIAGRWA